MTANFSNMNLYQFFAATKRQKPLLAMQGNIFQTPAEHIAFAVHWPNDAGHYNNNDGGFSSQVANHGWPELASIRFNKGEVRSKFIKGKTFHAMAVHTPQKGGWDETPLLIEECLNSFPVSNSEVIACVLIGGGHAGQKYKASVNNMEGMIRTYKTTVLYVYDDAMYRLLIAMGVVAQSLPYALPLSQVPKPMLYRESSDFNKLLEEAGVTEELLVV